MPQAIKYFKALSDETRLRLMHILARFELSVNELVAILEMGQSRVSRHLKILAEAGLVRFRRDGLWVFYAATESGEGHQFWKAVTPLCSGGPLLESDVRMAGQIIEERALKTRQFFNAIAEHWDTLSREVLGGFDLPGEVGAAMPRPCRVAVDLGCGTGAVLERMRERAELVIGVDGSPRMLELARRRFADSAEGLSLRIGELDHLPLSDGEADFACINMVLHHLSEPGPALREIRRVLRPGGRLLVTDFDRHEEERMRADYGDRWLGFSEAGLRALLTEAELVVDEVRRCPVEQGLALNLVRASRV